MKSSDFKRVDEGWDDIGTAAKNAWGRAGSVVQRSGIMGKRVQGGAQLDRQQKIAYDIGLKQFINTLDKSLKTAINSGIVSLVAASAKNTTPPATPTATPTPTPTQPTSNALAVSTPPAQVGTTSSTGGSTFTGNNSTIHKSASGREAVQQQAREKAEREKQERMAAQNAARTPRLNENYLNDYVKFENLIESIIAEAEDEGRAQTVAEYVVSFFQNQTAKEGLNIDANYKRQLYLLANQLQKTYDPKKPINTQIATQLWDLLWALSKSQQAKSQTTQQAQGGPEADKQRTDWMNNVVKSLNAIDANDPKSVGKLEDIIVSLAKFAKGIDPKAVEKITSAVNKKA